MSKTQMNYTEMLLTTWEVKPLKQFHIIISKSKESKSIFQKQIQIITNIIELFSEILYTLGLDKPRK